LHLTVALQPFQGTINGLGKLAVLTSHTRTDRKLEPRCGERHDAQCGVAPR
jgi:hypothetical protein